MALMETGLSMNCLRDVAIRQKMEEDHSDHVYLSLRI